jgi:hypothetical protein
VDVAVVGSLPLLVVLLRGAPTAGLVAGQLVWSGLLLAAALAHLVYRATRD